MTTLLLRFGAWRIAWTVIACGVVLIVAIAPAIGATPRTGDDEHDSCAAAGVQATPEVENDADEANEAAEGTEAEGTEADDEDCPEAAATPHPTPRATPHPTPKPTPRHTARPPSADDDQDEHETERDDEGDDD